MYKILKDPATYTVIDGKKYILMGTKLDTDGRVDYWVEIDKPEKRSCAICGYSGIALDEHHIYGRKNSDETVILCSNCHREVHAGLAELP